MEGRTVIKWKDDLNARKAIWRDANAASNDVSKLVIHVAPLLFPQARLDDLSTARHDLSVSLVRHVEEATRRTIGIVDDGKTRIEQRLNRLMAEKTMRRPDGKFVRRLRSTRQAIIRDDVR